MKKLLALMLAAALALSLTACGGAKVNYDEEFDSIMDRISELQEKADYVSAVNTGVWQEAGPDKIANILSKMRNASSKDDIESLDSIDKYYISEGLGISKAEIWTYVEKYNEYYGALTGDMETLKTDLKALKDACGKDHSDGIDSLQKYFSKLQAYADFATDPSGNLRDYHSNHQQFEADMTELQSAAEFDK